MIYSHVDIVVVVGGGVVVVGGGVVVVVVVVVVVNTEIMLWLLTLIFIKRNFIDIKYATRP